MKLIVAVTVFIASMCQALASNIADTSYQLDDGQRVLRHEVIVPVTLEQAYQAFSTADGWRTWVAEQDGWFVCPHGELLCRV